MIREAILASYGHSVHQPRPQRACTGELIQIDGSERRWFEDLSPACALLVYVDDATVRQPLGAAGALGRPPPVLCRFLAA